MEVQSTAAGEGTKDGQPIKILAVPGLSSLGVAVCSRTAFLVRSGLCVVSYAEPRYGNQVGNLASKLPIQRDGGEWGIRTPDRAFDPITV